MQFCHASKSLAESVFSSHLFGKRESRSRLPISFADPCTNPSPKPLPAGVLSLANTYAGGRIIYAFRVANSADLSDGIVREKGKVCHKRRGPSHCIQNVLDTRTCIRIYFPALLIGGLRGALCPSTWSM